MFTPICNALHETKQKNSNKLSRISTTDWKSSLKSNHGESRSDMRPWLYVVYLSLEQNYKINKDKNNNNDKINKVKVK